MKQTAGLLRLAVSIAAAIMAVSANGQGTSQTGPGKAATLTPTNSAAAVERPATGTRRDTYPFRGTIARVDLEERTVILEGRQARRVIRVLETTRLEREGRPMTLETLKQGERVGGTLRRNAAGQEEATLVRVVATRVEEEGRAGRAPSRTAEGREES
ncbi:MAG: hypothetical protein KF833_02070 [Verrucomicrobiae bacterium]|nr:hypothetical protein [Verrucomicrobiae bacterium]